MGQHAAYVVEKLVGELLIFGGFDEAMGSASVIFSILAI